MCCVSVMQSQGMSRLPLTRELWEEKAKEERNEGGKGEDKKGKK